MNSMVGMWVKLPIDSTPDDAIAEFRRRAEEQGVAWVEGSERAERLDYVREEDEVEQLRATDVRGGIFSLYVHVYEKVKSRRTRITGEVWGVRADEPPPPHWPRQIVAGFITDESLPQEIDQ